MRLCLCVSGWESGRKKECRCPLTEKIGKVPNGFGIKNPSANSCESLGAAHGRALGHGIAFAKAAQLGERAHERLLQEQQAGAGHVTKMRGMLEIVVDWHGEWGNRWRTKRPVAGDQLRRPANM